ncbi:MAG: type II pantothenate kinase [Clostridia bacterium]|nr:type II pantothenate kinase [Clostridia bacterium]
MDYIIGIDIGGSTTKIVGLESNGRLMGSAMVKASDPLTSAYGAFGRFLEETGLKLSQISKVMCTGVGASFLRDELYVVPVCKVDEFRAIGLGGKYISGLDHCIVVSMGTGTSVTCVNGSEITYVGGTGMGGGTILGLCGKLIGSSNYEHITELAEQGSVDKIDLMIGDITKDKLANMTNKTTASNFGKISEDANDCDLTMGVVNMVFQTVGIISMMAARGNGTDQIILSGSLSRIPAASSVIAGLEELYGVHYLIPEYSEYCTAIGAALYGLKEERG